MSVFDDKIDNYSNGATGSLTTPAGNTVGYTVSSNASTRDWGDVEGGAQIGQSSGFVQVTFDAPVNNAAIHISSSNVGEEYVVQVNGQDVNLNDLIASGDATFHNLGGNQVIDANGHLTATGSWTTMDTAVLQFHVPVSSLGVSGDGTGGGWDIFDIGLAGSALPCFCAGTRIETPEGPLAVEQLGVGDLVMTRDHGAQPVLWVGNRRCSASELSRVARRRPVQIEPGALGPGRPNRRLRLSRQHRVMIDLQGEEVLVPAAKLLNLSGVTIAAPEGAIAYHHVLLGRHEVLMAEGTGCESLFWGARSAGLFPQAFGAVPVAARLALMGMTPARRFLERKSDLLPVQTLS